MKSFLTLAALALFSLTGIAQTIEPDGTVRLPEELAVYRSAGFTSAQTLAKANAPGASFAKANPDWKFHFANQTAPPHRAWGKGIQIVGFPAVHMLNAESAARTFISDNRGILQADPASLRLLYARMANNKAYVRFIQQFNGIDVLFATIDLRISSGGKVFLFGSDYQPNISVQTVPRLGVDAAKEFAKVGLEYKPGTAHIADGTLYILPVKKNTTTTYHLVYHFLVSQSDNEIWDTYVDANDGAVLWRRNTVLHFHEGGKHVDAKANVVTGRIFVKVFNPNPAVPEEVVPCPYVTIKFNGQPVTTDANGVFTYDLGSATSATGVVKLVGPYAQSIRQDVTDPNDQAMAPVPVTMGQETSVYFDESNSTSAERNGFYHTTIVSRWIRGIDASDYLVDLDNPMMVNVNYSQESCNANWDGTAINFYRESNGCRNTATLASVIYHEYGHAINSYFYQALMGQRTYNGAIEEGNADITAAMLLDDPRIGLGMYKNGGDGLLRNCDNTNRFPDDFSGQIHNDGMILTGAVWDTRKAIGLERTRFLSHYVKYGTPDSQNFGIALADYFIEFLAADDDDNDLSNGTPNSQAIIEAFRKHGIPASGITITHTDVSAIQPAGAQAQIEGYAEMGMEIAPEKLYVNRVYIHYSTDNWTTTTSQEIGFDRFTSRFLGVVPAQPEGTILRYYLEAVDNVGSSFYSPAPVPSGCYAILYGFTEKYATAMEKSDNWTVSGDASTGIWVREEPVGTYNAMYGVPPDVPYVQPDDDHSPAQAETFCWVTGNTPPDQDMFTLMSAEDIDDGATILTTQSYDLTGMINPTVRYYRWYTNNAGQSPNMDDWAVSVSSDGGTSWTELERTSESIANWTPRIFALKQFITPTSAVMFRFTAEDAEPGSLVEAALDDFQILDHNGTVDVEQPIGIMGYALEQNYPNPFNPVTNIRFVLPARQWAQMKIYNALGTEVATPISGSFEAGTHTVQFDASALPSGVYTYSLYTRTGTLSRQMVISK